ncbi:MAG: right-handed parallel beta-helix repeat-containing protein [Planctomycetes bacterium]|nr:right-handed parallel beta-helix repeat-containing protein [Planctomycetota bacterium]
MAPAVAAAQPGETVFIAAGTYNREPAMTVPSGVHIRAGTLTLPAQTFTDGTCATTIIGSNAGPIFTCLGDAQICGVTLTSNKIPGEGAGVRANAGIVAISNSCLEHLEARDGAAVFATGTTLSLANTMVVDFRILDAHFTGNTGKSDEFSRLPVDGILAVNPGRQSSFPHSMADNDLAGPDKAGLAIGLFEESQEAETVDLARNIITRHTIGVHCSLGDTDFEGNEIRDMRDTGILFSHATGRLFQANHLIQNRVYQVQLQEESDVDIVETRLDGGGLSRFGISVDATSDAFIGMNDIYGHTRFGVEKLGAGPSVVTLQAIFNWWGHPSGANPPGSGDKISANVNAAFPRPAAFGW